MVNKNTKAVDRHSTKTHGLLLYVIKAGVIVFGQTFETLFFVKNGVWHPVLSHTRQNKNQPSETFIADFHLTWNGRSRYQGATGWMLIIILGNTGDTLVIYFVI